MICHSSNVGTPTIDVVGDEEVEPPKPRKRAKPIHKPSKPSKPTGKTPTGKTRGTTTSGTHTPTSTGDDWELDCEVCGRKGLNQVCSAFINI